MTVYFFYGEEDYNIDLEIEKMRSKLNPDFLSMSYQYLDNPDFSSLMSVLRATPMMFGDMLVVINANDYFLSNKNFFEDKELAEIEVAVNNTSESLNIVFVVKYPRDENKKIDSRRKLYKILSKTNAKEFAPYTSFQTKEIEIWLKNHAKTKELKIEEDAITMLVEQIGNNLRQFDGELDKLKLIAYPEKTVTKKMVQDICISNQDVFNFAELIINNKKAEALLEFKKLLDKKHPLELLSATSTMVRKWVVIKANSTTMSSFEISKLVGNKPYWVEQTMKKLKKVNLVDLVRFKQNLFEVEYKIKSAEAVDIISEVECAIIK